MAKRTPAYPTLKTGERTKYAPEFDDLAFRAKLLGATDEQLAKMLRVSATSISRWRNTIESFDLACRKGELEADTRVAEALYNRAIGTIVTDQVAIKVKKGKDLEEVEVIDLEKTIPPDTTAQMFWLRNRARRRWQSQPDESDDDERPTRDVRITFISPGSVQVVPPGKSLMPAFVDVTPKGTADD